MYSAGTWEGLGDMIVHIRPSRLSTNKEEDIWKDPLPS